MECCRVASGGETTEAEHSCWDHGSKAIRSGLLSWSPNWKSKRKRVSTSPPGRSACWHIGGSSQQDGGITWSDFWQSDMCCIRFLIQAVYDTLPSPANLHTWGKTETPACPLCAGRGSLQHLLSNCPTALAEGCYHWRHNPVLKAVAETVNSHLVFKTPAQKEDHQLPQG